jgi:hypothetical protein
MFMSYDFLKQYQRKEVPFMGTLRQNGFTTDSLANYLDVSYQYASNVLSGIYRLTKPIEKKLTKLTDRLEKGEAVNINRYRSKPTKYKAILKRHSVSTTIVSNYLGRSYSYVLGCLNGQIKMPDWMVKKLDSLVTQLNNAKGGKC